MKARITILLALLLAACSGAPTSEQSLVPPEEVVEVADSDILPVGQAVVRGKNDALITVHAFVDPASPTYTVVLREFARLSAAHGGELRLVLKAPAELSPAGRDALIAMHAAGQQGKFAPMHELLLSWRQSWLTGGALALAVSVGEEIQLDREQFRLALEDSSAANSVDAETVWADERGFSGTLALNGRPYFEMLEQVPLDAAVKESFERARASQAEGIARTELYARNAQAAAVLPPFGQPFRDSEVIPLGKSPSFGNRSGTIKMVAFMDFQCPYSRRAAVTMAQLVSENREVELVFKHFPLEFHKQARDAAAISVAAAAQGRFWEMSEQLFLNQQRFQSENMDELASELGNRLKLDIVKLLDDRDAAYAMVDADIALGHELGVKGTPHFFVNGKRVSGAQPLEAFQTTVKEQLELAKTLDVRKMNTYAKSVERSYAPVAPKPKALEGPSYSNVPVDKSDPMRGKKSDYLVTLVEFADYQCPFCQRAQPTIKQVLDEYGDKIRVVYKHRPLAFHQSALPAAQAAVAAGKQGKFWQMHDALFESRLPGADEVDAYAEKIAKKLGLKMKQFRRDRDKAKSKVEADDKIAVDAGARGTPTFFINGQKLTGAQPFRNFQLMIEEELSFAKEVQVETDLKDGALYDEILKRHAESD